MPSVLLNKKVFEKLVGKSLPVDELKDRISMLGTDLDGIEGNDIHVEVFPNRPDMLSEQGFARAFSSFIGVKTGIRKYDVKPSGEKVIIDKSVKTVRPYTVCCIVKDLKLDDEKIREIIQLQEKLHVTFGRNRKKMAIGIYPLEKIKLPITFFAKDPKQVSFKPLEEKKEMNGLEILENNPTGKEYAHLLEGKKEFPFFKDAKGSILSMPPIINSHETGKIVETTKEVFIECSGFDFNTLGICLNIIVTTLADMGASIYSMELDYSSYKEKNRITPDLTPRKMDLDIAYVNKMLGLELSEKDVKKELEKMGYGYDMNAKEKKVLVPAYRADILHEIDLVEDVAIAYGYENFEVEIPDIATIGEAAPFEVFKKRVANILIGHGLLETNTFHLSSLEDQTEKMNCNIDVVELENSMNEGYSVLRAWMLPNQMKILSENKHHEYPQNIFEMGVVFKHNKDTETGVEEFTRLVVTLCSGEADFTKTKQIMDSLFKGFDIEYTSENSDHGSFTVGRCARISVNGIKVAYIGEIAPEVLENWQLEMPVSAFELNLTEIFRIMYNKD